ncbi:MAG: hypothetical protein WAT93_12920, partial [Pontixanthobacter sp.]
MSPSAKRVLSYLLPRAPGIHGQVKGTQALGVVENVGGEDEFVRALALDESLRCRTHGGWAQVDEVLLWCSASQKRRQPSRSPVCASSSVLTTVCPGVLP